MENCRCCHNPRKPYSDGLCFECAMNGHTPDSPPAIVVPLDEDDLTRAINQAQALRDDGVAEDLYQKGQWVFSPARMERLRSQVRHIQEQTNEAIKERSFAKLQHLEASVAELARLIPGAK